MHILFKTSQQYLNTYFIYQSPDYEETANAITVTKKTHARLFLKASSVILQKHSQRER